MSTRSARHVGSEGLVGRRHELDAFRDALDAVHRGRACLVQVGGEIGIGRSRLLQALAELAEANNALSVLTRPGPAHDQPLGALKRPELTATLPRLAAAVADTSRHEARFGRLLAALAVEAEQAPVWLLIDDLHHADEATRVLTERLVAAIRHGSLRDCRLGLVLSRLEQHAPATDDRAPQRDRWHFELQRLRAAEVHEWLSQRFALPPDRDLLELLMDTSRGNPLLVSEMLVFLSRSGYLQQHTQHIGLSPRVRELTLPTDLITLLQGKVGALSGPCRRAMTLAAFLGNEFDARALGELLGQTPEDVDALLEEAAGTSLVERRAGRMFGFKHPAARELLYGRFDRRSRQETHLHISQRLIDELGSQAEEHALTITHHLLRAGQAADPAQVLQYAALAGETAFAHHSYYLAGRYFEAAARAAGHSLGCEAQAALYIRAGEAFQRWSDGARSSACFERALELHEGSADLAGHTRALAGLLRNRVAFGDPGGLVGQRSRDQQMDRVGSRSAERSYSGEATAAIAARLQALLTALPESQLELKVRVHDTLASHYHETAHYDVAETYAQTALTLAQSGTDPGLRCIPVTSLALAQMEQLRLTEARTTWLEGLSYDRAAGARRYEGLHLQRLPVPLYCLGEVHEAARYSQLSYHHNEAIGNTGELALNLTVDVMIANLRGDFDAAIRTGWSAMELMENTRYLWGAPALIGALACALTMRERFDDAEQVVAHLSTDRLIFPDTSPYRSTANRLRELVGAHRGLAAAGPADERPVTQGTSTLRAVRLGSLARLCHEAELALLQGRPARLGGIHDALEFVGRRDIALALGWCCSVPRSLAVSTALRSGPSRAERYFQQAERLAERAGAPLELGRVALYRGLTSLRCGLGPQHARAPLERALGCFSDLGVAALARLAENALSQAEQSSQASTENNNA